MGDHDHEQQTMQDLYQEDPDRFWFANLCRHKPELFNNLHNPQTAADHLLRMRAYPLLDHVRLYRVALARQRAGRISHLLEDIHHSDFGEYLNELSEVDQLIGDCAPHGYILTKNPEAMCLHTDGGKVIVVSEALRYALYFMNVAASDIFGLSGVPTDVRGSAFTIAARTMLLNEALDFDIDPRGIVPEDIEAQLEQMTKWQIKFVIGHEFAHHRLGHSGTKGRPFRGIGRAPGGEEMPEWTEFDRSWEEEFEADLGAIEAAVDADSRRSLSLAAVLFFLYLEFFERIGEALDPELAHVNTHPPTIDRLLRIIEKFGSDLGVDTDWAIEGIEFMRTRAADLALHHGQIGNLLTMYGSVYLGSWQGPILRDRIDY